MARYNKTRWAKMVALSQLLTSNHPKTFVLITNMKATVYPLKIGIGKEIRELYPDVEVPVLNSFLEYYVSTRQYLAISARAGMPRVDLNGDVASVITPDEATGALHKQAMFDKTRPKKKLPHKTDMASPCERTGKTKYNSAFDANQAMERTHNRSGTKPSLKGTSFKCGCGFYHWGNN